MRNAEKNSKLRSILFEQQSISRQNLIQLSGVNPRTVSRCMDKLAEKQLITVTCKANGPGRPSQYYTLRMENVRTLHFMITDDEIFTVISNIHRFPIYLYREEFKWNKNRLETLVVKLKQSAKKALELPEIKNGFVIAACAGYWMSTVPPAHIKQRLSDTLETIIQCKCPVFNANALLLSQYQINNHLTGKIVGLTYRNDIQCVAVNDSVIDSGLRLKAEKIVSNIAPRDMGFINFIKNYSPEALNGLKKFMPQQYYNTVCMLAMSGNQYAVSLLRDFGKFLGKILIALAETEMFDHIVLMHPRQIESEEAQKNFSTILRNDLLKTVNFSPNEFILAPAGYLNRGVRVFEHGRILSWKDYPYEQQ